MFLSVQLLDAGRFEDAVNHMADVIDLGGQMDFAAISARTQRLPAERRSRQAESSAAVSAQPGLPLLAVLAVSVSMAFSCLLACLALLYYCHRRARKHKKRHLTLVRQTQRAAQRL